MTFKSDPLLITFCFLSYMKWCNEANFKALLSCQSTPHTFSRFQTSPDIRCRFSQICCSDSPESRRCLEAASGHGAGSLFCCVGGSWRSETHWFKLSFTSSLWVKKDAHRALRKHCDAPSSAWSWGPAEYQAVCVCGVCWSGCKFTLWYCKEKN